MNTNAKIIVYTFIFNIFIIILFSFIYASISPTNFQPLNQRDKITYVDYLFYATTIQSSVGLPDLTALSDLSKILAMIQQLTLMASTFIVLYVFVR